MLREKRTRTLSGFPSAANGLYRAQAGRVLFFRATFRASGLAFTRVLFDHFVKATILDRLRRSFVSARG
ncbi:hypothetical protein FGO68_gene8037 [Halteria grandinella]|uniref:Uncharacterized protein n=1 Tax=Halteria grandinella TaxID=5974 RepID=A0A8J8NB02_HALGN|nr:hypothetical protein FGO68_gene8037 [Halteria grandinella]